MPTKKTSKPTKSKRRASKKAKPTKKLTRKSKPAKKVAKKAAAKKAVAKNAAPKRKAAPRKTTSAMTVSVKKSQTREKARRTDVAAFSPEAAAARSTSGRQSGELQGLSNREGADSQSVDELLEEGNAFEAEVVSGVEDAEDSEDGEVHTHEVPEDDVPGEYLDKD